MPDGGVPGAPHVSLSFLDNPFVALLALGLIWLFLWGVPKILNRQRVASRRPPQRKQPSRGFSASQGSAIQPRRMQETVPAWPVREMFQQKGNDAVLVSPPRPLWTNGAVEYMDKVNASPEMHILTPFTAPPAYTMVKGAGRAAENPPVGIQAMLVAMREDWLNTYEEKPAYCWPFGWYIDDQGGLKLVWARLVKGINHILITGTNDSGKDTAVFGGVLSLMQQHTPAEYGVYILDGKGLSQAIFKNKAHVKFLALWSEEFEQGMKVIDAERLRRQKLFEPFATQGIDKWEDLPLQYRLDNDMPLVSIVVSELSLLMAVPKFTDWLTRQMVAWRAFGGRFVIGTQFVNNMETGWRGQLSVYMGFAQPAAKYNEPNVGFGAEVIKAMGGVPPSELPPVPTWAGCATVVSPGLRVAITVRTANIDRHERMRVLNSIPTRTTDEVLQQLLQEKLLANNPSVELQKEEKEFDGIGRKWSNKECAEWIIANPQPSISETEYQLFGTKEGGYWYKRVKECIAIADELRESITTGDP